MEPSGGPQLRPIVSSIGTIFYKCARYLAKVLSPLVGKTELNVRNSNELVKEVREIKLGPDEELRCYDVSALFMSVLITKALELIRLKLEEDNTLSERTPLEPDNIIRLSPDPCGRHGLPVFPPLCAIYTQSLLNKRL